MRRCLPLLALAGLALSAASVATATPAADPVGRWNREDGLGGIRIATCGPALCGFVVWLKDPGGPARVGDRVLYDMRQVADDTWSGSAHNPEDGREYAGTLKLDGDRLVTRGCILAGLICKSVLLLRER